jgi:hypothetical protein
MKKFGGDFFANHNPELEFFALSSSALVTAARMMQLLQMFHFENGHARVGGEISPEFRRGFSAGSL